MELILQARAFEGGARYRGPEAATRKDCQDFFIERMAPVDLGNHVDYEAANDTAGVPWHLGAIWLFGEDTAVQWMEKLATATAPSEVPAGDAQPHRGADDAFGVFFFCTSPSSTSNSAVTLYKRKYEMKITCSAYCSLLRRCAFS